MRDLLIKQITDELASGKTDTLNEILASELDEKKILKRLTKENLAILEERKPNFELKGGMLIRAKKDLTGTSNSYNTPERIDIPKGSILKLPNGGTNRGDVFCSLVEGQCVVHLRSMYRDTNGETSIINGGDNHRVVGLREGVETRYPCDLGLADKTCWEIIFS
jgi:hypothetical protein